MNLHYRVQTVPARHQILPRLLHHLPVSTDVVVDEGDGPPSPWRGYLRCLTDPWPDSTTHMVILQDDVVPADHFGIRVQQAVEQRPADIISLFVGGLPGPARKAFLAAQFNGEPFAPIRLARIFHVVALVWPVDEIRSFVEWQQHARLPGPTPPRSDDAIVGYWARVTHRTFWATVPCLVEHPDDVPSTIGRKPGSPGRKAILFAG